MLINVNCKNIKKYKEIKSQRKKRLIANKTTAIEIPPENISKSEILARPDSKKK